MPFIEGGWPGSNPKDIEFFAAARSIAWEGAKLAAFGSTRHRSNKPGDDPNLRELVAAETPVVTIFGKSWLLHVTEVLGATPAENLDMIADSVGFIVEHGREVVYDAEHFFDGYKADPRLCARHAPGRPAGGARGRSSCATRTAARCRTNSSRSSPTSVPRSRRSGRAGGHLGHPHPQRRRAGGRQLHGGGGARASAMSRAPSTATANAAATPTWCRILANLALKTPHVLVPAGGGHLDGLTELSRSVAEIANVNPNDYQPYVGRSAFAHKGGVHVPPWPRSSGATSTWTRSSSATPGGSWSRTRRTGQHGHPRGATWPSARRVWSPSSCPS